MLNFLPSKNKKKITFEYLLRVGAFVCAMITIITVILIGLFIPSVIFSSYKYQNISNQLSNTQALYQQDGGEDPVEDVRDINRMAAVFPVSDSENLAASDLIGKIVALKSSDIIIASISFSKTASVEPFTINGTAKTRDALTSFENNLKSDGTFTDVTLPVGDLIPDTNAQFSITMTYHQTTN